MSDSNAEEKSSEKSIDVLAIGNAIVDILVRADEKYIESLGVKKGSMTLLDEDKAKKLFKLFESIEKSPDSTVNEMSGGCSANVAVGINSFGGKASFIGKVSDDKPGELFVEKLKSRGVEFSSTHMTKGKETGRSLIIVTENGSRTMCTYLGSSQEISASDIDESLIAKSKVVFISGFLFDCEKGKEAAIKAIELAKKNNCKVAFTAASDSCTERHRAEFIDIIDNHADIVFLDNEEVMALFETDKLEDATNLLQKRYSEKESVAVITCIKEGATVISKGDPIKVAAIAVSDIKDSTGSGALFASGFLYGHTHGFDLEKSATLGSLSSAEALKVFGARSSVELKNLIAKV